MIAGEVTRRRRRLSLTFRAVRHGCAPCRCPFSLYCDSQQAAIPSSRKDWEAAKADAGGGDSAEDGGGAPALQPKVAGPIRVPAAAQEDAGGSPEIERTNVHEVYDAIAHHFSATRYKPWPRVKSFLDALPVRKILTVLFDQ
jgi:alkylated DNA repair protein alkB family protein 8